MDESTQTKACCRCGQSLPVSQFYRRAASADGLTHACKGCLAERKRQRDRMTSADRVAEVAALVSRTEKLCSTCGEVKPRAAFNKRSRSRDGMEPSCRSCRQAWQREHYERNRDERLRQCAEWYAANAERKNATSRAYYAANRDRLLDHYREWFASRPGYRAEATRRRRALMLGADVSDVDLDALWTGLCALCDGALDREARWPDPDSPSVDHIVPLSRGGAHAQHNLQWTHLNCNVRKSDNLLT